MMKLADILLGSSPAMVALGEQVARLLQDRRDEPILILGETGSGKSTLAYAMHRLSARGVGPFVEGNLAIPHELIEAELFGAAPGGFCDGKGFPGLLHQAHGGTIFLDEIDLLPLPLQAKLLKVLDDKKARRVGGTQAEAADVSLIAAASCGHFRANLNERLTRVTLRIPPLRDRGADILMLADHFLARANREHRLPLRRLDAEARRALLGYPWPGNALELFNVMERGALLAETEETATITASSLNLAGLPGTK
jgi:transcriptional regulator of aroF, aroG, tyrA and aromatic amino acid transport